MFFLKPHLADSALPGLRRGDHVFLRQQLQKATVNAVCVGAVVLAFLMSPAARSAVHPFRARHRPALREDHLHMARQRRRPSELRQARRHSAPISMRDAGFLLDPLSGHLAPFRDRRGHADPHLLHRIHGARRRLLPLLRIPEPVHVLDAHAHPGKQLRAAVCRMGRRGTVFVPADRFLFPSQVGQSTPPTRRSSSTASAMPDSCSGMFTTRLVLGFVSLHRRQRAGAQRALFRSATPFSPPLLCCCLSALAASRRSFLYTSGCPTRWRVPLRFQR